MSSRALLIFARTPEAEAAAKRLPLASAAPLFRAVLRCWIASASAAPCEDIANDVSRAVSQPDATSMAPTSFCARIRGCTGTNRSGGGAMW